MNKLEVQKYLRSGKSLNDLKNEYLIEYVINDDLNAVVLNYLPNSDKSKTITRESRALILELKTWNIVAKSIDAFFEPENVNCKNTLLQFDWEGAYVLPKYDGCLFLIYFWKNQWNLGTRFSVDSKCKVFSPNSGEINILWDELFKDTLSDYGMTWDDFTFNLNKSESYVFELCTKLNRNTIIYAESLLKLIAIVDIDTLEEKDVFNSKLKVFWPEKIMVKNLDEAKQIIEMNNNPLEVEGFVIIDSNFNRIKLRNEEFNKLSSSSIHIQGIQALKNYSTVISLVASGTEWYCITCTGSEMDPLAPYTACQEVEIGGSPITTGYIGCTYSGPYTSSVDCSNNCIGGYDQFGQQSLNVSGCTTSWSPKSLSVTKSNYGEVIQRFLAMINWITKSYESFKLSNSEDIKNEMIKVWSYAFHELEQGKSISEIIKSSNEVDQYLALEIFEFNKFTNKR
jgi:hypothetical protein